MPDRTSLSVGLIAIVIGLLAISAVVIGGSDTPEPVEVNTSADANELLVQTHDRLAASDYKNIRIHIPSPINQTDQRRYAKYIEVSHSNKRWKAGPGTDADHFIKQYGSEGGEWLRGGPGSFELAYQNGWHGPLPLTQYHVDNLSDVNATVRERTTDKVVVEIPNASSVSRHGNVENRSERWVFKIDGETGNLCESEIWINDSDGDRSLFRSKFEYGITVERPEEIPFSLKEQYYRFLAMDIFEQIGLVVGTLLILIGCLALYREYPLHRKLR